MLNKKLMLLVALLALVGLAPLASLAQEGEVADSWGDLGYANPQPDIEVLPSEPQSEESMVPETQTVVLASSSAESAVVTESDLAETSKESGTTNVSTVKNTYGVMTEEKPSLQIFAAPFAGVASSFGNETVTTTPNYAAGATVGLLVSSNLLVQLSFTHSEQGVGAPNQPNSMTVFTQKTNQFDGGARLFFLGRESKFRPFFGAGLGYANSSLSYLTDIQTNFQKREYTVNQVKGFGEIGVEYAITRMFVAMASFKIDGVLSSNTSADSSPNTQNAFAPNTGNFDQTQAAGSSLSRSASYAVGAGVGIYF